MAMGSSFYSEQAITYSYLKSAHKAQVIVIFGCNWSKEQVKKTKLLIVNSASFSCSNEAI